MSNNQKFKDARVQSVFSAYPPAIAAKLIRLRQLIFDVALQTPDVDELEETLKWGQPSYLTTQTGSGSTIRIDRIKSQASYAIFFNCQTTLVESFRTIYPEVFPFQGNRSLIFDVQDDLPLEALSRCISLALTYHKSRFSASSTIHLRWKT